MNSKSINNFLNNLLKEGSEKNYDFCYIKDGRYYNELFEISFKIPEDWFVINMGDYKQIVDEQILVGEYEYYKDQIEAFYEHPSFLITKYNPKSDKYFGLVSPTLNFNIIAKEPEYKGYSLKKYSSILHSQEENINFMLKNFRIINKGEEYNVNGFDYIKCDTEYLFEHVEIDFGIMVEMSILNIENGDFFLDFSMTDCKAQNQNAKDEFDRIIKSIILK